ncbi:MAG: carboxy terminal-processing peptidase [Candidatus Aminicenantes bacterium]|nr:carboxy terminal-processing peptidase [Candidatus Aminicenantes bacterium]
MHYRFLRWISLVFLFCGVLNADESPRQKILSRIFYQSLQQWHYAGVDVDDDFSRSGFKHYFRVLDPNKQFFTSSDLARFQPFLLKLDDQLAQGKYDLMVLASEQMRKRINEIRKFLPELAKHPFDFSRTEAVELDGEKREWSTDVADLREYWRLLLKHQALIRFLGRGEEKTDGPETVKKELEKAQADSLKSYMDMLERMLKSGPEDDLARYANAVLGIGDPHTAYFPPKEQKDFEIEMTGKLEGIGALLGEADGYVEIVSLVPGGPSWRQKQLEPHDRILKVGQGKNGPSEDIVGMRVEDAVKLIRGPKGSVVRLTVRKADGRIEEVAIERDVVVIEETFARSTVVRGETLETSLGYIYLPRFYNDFQDKNGRNSTEDVRRELNQLKQLGVSGIILDLRGNTGGALTDAVRIAGLFIEKGPVVQVRDRIRGTQVLNDPDDDEVFSGPLMVMIDRVSASASEIVAAALQDYNRALVVGGAHSFGKGTVQQMIDLDRIVPDQADKLGNPLGALKLTVQKFYRVNGESNQFKGVQPDVYIPNTLSHLEIGERYLPFALNGDRVKELQYPGRKEITPELRERLRSLSRERIATDPYFVHLSEYVRLARINRESTNVILNLEQVRHQREELRQCLEKVRERREKGSGLVFLDRAQIDDSGGERLTREYQERRRDWLETLGKDHVLKEGVRILEDMIRLTGE